MKWLGVAVGILDWRLYPFKMSMEVYNDAYKLIYPENTHFTPWFETKDVIQGCSPLMQISGIRFLWSPMYAGTTLKSASLVPLAKLNGTFLFLVKTCGQDRLTIVSGMDLRNFYPIPPQSPACRYVRNRGFSACRYSEFKFSKNNDHKKWVRFVYNGMPQDRNPKFECFSLRTTCVDQYISRAKI